MIVTLIGGENTALSRARFGEIIDQKKIAGFEIERLGNNDLNLSELVSSNSLFSDKRLLVIDDFKKFGASDLSWLGKNLQKYDGEILGWIDGDVPVKISKQFGKNLKVEEFVVPKVIFAFLDSIYPGNQKMVFQFLEKLKGEPVEFVVHMIARHLRDLYWAKMDPKTLALPDWRLKKLKNQASKFDDDLLKNIINELAEADVKAKTGGVDLRTSLDLVISRELE